jgi:hypothetical protein
MAAPDQIADYLITQSIGTAVGTDVFVHQLPQSPDVAFMVAQFAMGGTIRTMPAGAQGRIGEQVGLQIQCRAADRATAEANAYAVYKLLDGIVNTTIGGTLYFGILGKRSPQQLKIDQQQRFVWYVEFTVTKVIP